MSTIYLLHFDRPLPQRNHRRGVAAQHYLGITDDLDARLREHANGNGSKLVAALKQRGGSFALVRVWHNAERANELELKRQRNNPRLCPYCTRRARAKLTLHGDNKKFHGWGKRQDYAKLHVKGLPAPESAPEDELPF